MLWKVFGEVWDGFIYLQWRNVVKKIQYIIIRKKDFGVLNLIVLYAALYFQFTTIWNPRLYFLLHYIIFDERS